MSLSAVPEQQPYPDPRGGPVCFLIDANGPVERRLIDEWLEQHQPDAVPHSVVRLPASRRRRRRRSGALAVLDTVERYDDPLLIPVRVAWMSRAERKRRTPRLIDLISLGDPRDPNRLLQEVIVRLWPDRARVITGEAAKVSQLRERFTGDQADSQAVAEYVYLRGALALEVAERRLRGNRYKVPRFLAEDLLSNPGFRSGLARIAADTDEELDAVEARAAANLREIAATPSTFVIDLVAVLVRLIYTMAYHHRIQYDEEALDQIATLGREHGLAFLPSHKSNMDHLALTYVLYENGLPPNHAAAGDNINFFPVGPLLRRHGNFFIRRSFKDDEVYKYVLKSYIGYLLSKRFPLEWYMEGGRSRSGKLRGPRYGMLSYVVDAWRQGECDDVVLVPTSIAYDQIQDVAAHAAEQRGVRKERETLGWMLRAIRSLRRRYGRIYLNFGEPIFLSEALGPNGPDADTERTPVEVAKLAFETALRINRATPITPISLVTLVLLGTGDRALTVAETHQAIRPYIDFVEQRELPITEPLDLEDPAVVQAALEALVEHGVVSRFDGGPETVYAIDGDKHLSAAFYRNTIIHWFTTGAIVELALAFSAQADDESGFWDGVWSLRDLLKFEFFFAERDEFADEVGATLALQGTVAGLSGEDARTALRSFRPLTAHWVLRPILEAYLVLADALVERDFRRDVSTDDLIKECLARGEQYARQRRIRSPEAVSTVLFESAARLADNRGLLQGGGVDQLRKREAFAAEIRATVEAVDVVEEVASSE